MGNVNCSLHSTEILMALVWTENGSFGLKTATTLVKYILAQLLMHANMIYCLKKTVPLLFLK